jgi:hypothetical protein
MKDVTIPITILCFGLVYGVLWLSAATNMKHALDDFVAMYVIAWGLYAFLSDLPRTEFRKRFLLMTASLTGCLLLMELPVALGVLDYRTVVSEVSGPLWAKPAYQLDPELIWVHKPHRVDRGTFALGNIGQAVCAQSTTVQEFDLRYDRYGFRNDHDLEQADIALIGDSYIESPMTPSSDLATRHLETLQNRSVINLGASGYGPQQEFVTLKRYALPLRPRTVVWAFFEGNDLLDAGAYKERVAMMQQRDVLDALWERSFTKRLFATLLTRECVPHIEIQQHYGYVREASGQARKMYFAMEEAKAIDWAALSETRQALEAAYQLCQNQGIDLIVAFVPHKFRVYHDIADLSEASPVLREWPLNDLPQQLEAMVANINPKIGFLDLTHALHRSSQEGLLTYLPDDTHWTPEGHKVVAHAIHEFLLSRPSK